MLLTDSSNPQPARPLDAAADCANVAFDAASIHHRAERNRRIFRSFVSALCTKPLASIISFVSVPLFITYLHPERYGFYETIVALPSWLGLTNIGLSYSLINQLTDCHVRDDKIQARRYVSSVFFPLMAMMLGLVILASVTVPFIPWQRFFVISDPSLRTEIPRVIWATTLVTFVAMIVTIPGSVYSAYQELDRNNYWDGVGKLLTLLGCFAVVHTHTGLMGVAMVVVATPSIVRLINSITLVTLEKPWLRPRLASFDSSLFRSALHDGISLFLLQSATIAIFQSDKFIISWARGGVGVTEFATIGRLFLLAYGTYSLISAPLWPAYGEALRRGDVSWARRTLRRCTLIGVGTMALCGIALFIFGDTIMRLWTRGQSVHCSRSLVVPMTAMFIVRIMAECPSVFLNAANIIRPQVILLGSNAVLNFALAIVLAKKFGVVGVAWSFPVSAVFTTLWGYPWLLARVDRLAPAVIPRSNLDGGAGRGRMGTYQDDAKRYP